MISGNPLFCIACAFVLLVLPVNWLLSAAVAALVHEACHLLAVIGLGGAVKTIRISLTGCRIDTGELSNIKSILCILSGPVGSLSLFALGRKFPRIAVCGLIQGSYNLLPILPLDGGRILRCILDMVCPSVTETVMRWIRRLVAFCVIAAAVLAAMFRQWDIFTLIFCLMIAIGIVGRKIPCKDYRIGLQWY